MLQSHQPTDPAVHALCVKIARRCRNIIQACLREEEWGDADMAFFQICLEELSKKPARLEEI